MVDLELTRMNISELAPLIREKRISPVEVTEAHLERIETVNPKINAFITRLDDEARNDSHQAEREILEGKYRGPLHGIPMGLKDLYWTRGIITTSGSSIDAKFIPDQDAAVTEKLAAAGGILMGKLNTVEFAYGSSEHNVIFGDTRNPWDVTRITGGSSTGSGASVAARILPYAMGSDTAGSVRMPACLCGITGFKPSYGLISRFGITPLSPTLDHSGPLARSVYDIGLIMNAVVGHDVRDRATVSRDMGDFTQDLDKDIRGLRLGIPWDYIQEALHPDVENLFREALGVLKSLGASVEEVSIPEFDLTRAMLIAIAGTESVDFHYENLQKRGGEYTETIRKRIESARFLPASVYVKAQRARRLLGIRLAQTFQQFDILVMPSLGVTAPVRGTEFIDVRGKLVTEQEMMTRTMRIFNMNGLPAISVPCGLDPQGLPAGLQFAGPLFKDKLVLQVANAYQSATNWHKQSPSI